LEESILSPQSNENDKKSEHLLRPENFKDYVGQKKVVENIKLMVESAKIRKSSMDHVLLSGPPGLGKTSLAMLISRELGVNLHVVSGPALEKKGDLASLLTNLEANDVLFIDEIHRINIAIEEILYSAMEDYKLDIVLGEGAAARTMQIDLHPFTLVGATTRSGLLSNPLRDRFVAHLHFDFYEPEDLSKIILNNSKKMNIELNSDSISLMSGCSRGTPRVANRILRRVRDYALVEGLQDNVQAEVVEKALSLMEIDSKGLDRMDRRILKVIYDYYNGGPVGIDALTATLSEDRSTLEDVYEPYLLKEGYLIRTPRGREISKKAMAHMGFGLDDAGPLFKED
jgi:Holliday junction DNA helicase RuvB